MAKDNQLQINKARLTYIHLEEPHAAAEGADPKYSVCLIIPKNHDQVETIKRMVKEAVARKWGDKAPKGLRSALRDGDAVDENGERLKGKEFSGCYFMTASNKRKVGLKAWKSGQPATSDDLVWGYYGSVLVSFFAYDAAGNRGIGAGLDGVWITAKGEPLGGAAASWDDGSVEAEDFSAIAEQATAAGQQTGDIF